MEKIKQFIEYKLYPRRKMSKYIWKYITPDVKKRFASSSKEDVFIAVDVLFDALCTPHMIDKSTEDHHITQYCAEGVLPTVIKQSRVEDSYLTESINLLNEIVDVIKTDSGVYGDVESAVGRIEKFLSK